MTAETVVSVEARRRQPGSRWRRAAVQAAIRLGALILVLGQYGAEGPFFARIAVPPVGAFLVLYALYALAEGLTAPPAAATSMAEIAGDPARRGYVMAAKRYTLASLLFQAFLLINFAHLHWLLAPPLPPLHLASLGLFVAGAALRVWSMVTLGESFQGWSVEPGRGLRRSRSYRVVRHPAYLGLLLMLASMAGIFRQWWALVLALVPAAFVIRRIQHEEQLLRAAYPEEYDAYAAETWRLLPWIY